MKQRIRWICLLILTLCLFYNSLPSPVFGQEEGTSLAEQVFEKYRVLFQREDIQALLPPFLVRLKDPEIQPLLNPATIGLIVDNPDLLIQFIPDIDPAFVTLLKEDAELQALLSDPLVHALLQDPAAIDELLGLLGVGSTLPDVVDIPDPSLRAEIAHALGKTPGDAITRAEMETLDKLSAQLRDITDLRGLEYAINLTDLYLDGNIISDISPLSNLTRLTGLSLWENIISDISPLSNLTHLENLSLWENIISDISPLSNLTRLTGLSLGKNIISDISPLSNLTNLTGLYLAENIITDISPLSNLTRLTGLSLAENIITDISPLIGLVNLQFLRLAGNPIEDLSSLHVILALNPDLDVDIPLIDKITGPWLWMIAPTEPGQGGAASTHIDSLAIASGGTVTEADVARNGANEGDSVGNYAWTPAEISAYTGNINDVVNDIGFLQRSVNDHSSYALITLNAPTSQPGVIMKVGSDDSVKVWLNGEVVHAKAVNRARYDLVYDFRDTFQVNLVAGENLLLVKVSQRNNNWTMFVGIDAEFTVQQPPPDQPPPPAEPPANINLDVNGDGLVNVIDLMWVALFYGTRGDGLLADVNADGIVNVADFAAVAAGVDAANSLPQGMEQVLLAALEQAVEIEGVAEAPMGFGRRQHASSADLVYGNVAAVLADARLLATDDARLSKGIALLETLLQLLTEMRAIPETTALLPNYPNPFNPETWIPYTLSTDADVMIEIYATDGSLVRRLAIGHHPAGFYVNKARAAHWDGRNAVGEPVVSGLYFYTLTAGDFTATRKLLIRK